ncbi:HTH domain-containing protein [Candidatus Woesearchaeota archaeon]|nr:HTH domain-containing protein [Candidatus Woesearchaeota archaeon]
MAQEELIDFLSEKENQWFLSKDLVDELNISRTAVIRGLTKLSKRGVIVKKPLKIRGFAYKINPQFS